jgi:hypothetical protein
MQGFQLFHPREGDQPVVPTRATAEINLGFPQN